MCHVPGLDNFLLKDLGKALALLYLAIGRLQGLKDKRRCCGCNILLAFRNGNATVTGGRSFARQGNDHFPEISKKLKKRTWLWIFTGTANGPIHPQNQPRKRKKPTGGPVGEKSKNGGAGGCARYFSNELKIRCKIRFSSVKISNLACHSRKHPTAYKR